MDHSTAPEGGSGSGAELPATAVWAAGFFALTATMTSMVAIWMQLKNYRKPVRFVYYTLSLTHGTSSFTQTCLTLRSFRSFARCAFLPSLLSSLAFLPYHTQGQVTGQHKGVCLCWSPCVLTLFFLLSISHTATTTIRSTDPMDVCRLLVCSFAIIDILLN